MTPGGPVAIPSLDTLASDPSQIDGLPPEVVKALWVDVRNLEKVLVLRMLTAPSTASPPEDRLIGIDEASALLGMSKDRLYRTEYPFVIRDGGLLRFSNNGIQRWIKNRLRQG
ncbi:MAG: hypothetical protein HOO98_01220 [Nitrospira sp.]|nr:hypothetical protein [Nitrospira sp.]